MKFLCDTMCSELGKWLRIAGHDTEIVLTSEEDQLIFEKAVQENRILLTRDKDFKELDPGEETVFWLKSDSLDDSAKQIKEKLNLNWLYHPFSRCLKCNTLLKKTEHPAEFIEGVDKYWECPSCRQIFWLGSHTEHMREQLVKWQG